MMKILVRRWFCRCSLALSAALLTGCGTALSYEKGMTFQASDEPLGDGKFQIIVKKTRFLGGRDGELWQIFKQRAADIAKREQCSGYTVLEYTEGIESAIVAGNHVGRGTIECIKAPVSKS